MYYSNLPHYSLLNRYNFSFKCNITGLSMDTCIVRNGIYIYHADKRNVSPFHIYLSGQNTEICFEVMSSCSGILSGDDSVYFKRYIYRQYFDYIYIGSHYSAVHTISDCTGASSGIQQQVE